MMLNQKFFGFSLSTWIVIAFIVFYFFYCTQCDMENFSSEENHDEEINKNISDELSEELNDEVTEGPLKVYNFNTSWCGHSKNFQPTWDEFMKKNNGKNGVVIKDVKCDDEEDTEAQALCEKFDVPGYPSVIFSKGSQKMDYMGPRTVESLEAQIRKLQ